MTNLAADRNTPRVEGDVKSLPMSASKIYAGAIVCRNATGYAAKGAVSTTLIGVGRADEQVDNSGGNPGDKRIRVREGKFIFNNSSAGDLITIADIGKPAYIVDDNTVAKTSGTNTRSIAGFIDDVVDTGVVVKFDEAAVQSYLAGIANPA